VNEPLAIVITGSPGNGFAFHGPFLNSEYACSFAETFVDEDWWLAPLIPVDDDNDMPGDNWSGFRPEGVLASLARDP
jgi:hypothetical protein